MGANGWSRRAALVAAVLGLAVPAGAARAAVIGFETATADGNGDLSAPVTEGGFTYATRSGALFVDTLGHPGQDLEGDEAANGGVLDITRAGNQKLFAFLGLDYSAYAGSGTGSQVLGVTGLLGGVTVATDSFTLANTATDFPGYGNWTTELAAALAGRSIDELRITLAGGINGEFPFSQNIDNVALTAVPEPASLGLLGIGMVGAGLVRRRRSAAG